VTPPPAPIVQTKTVILAPECYERADPEPAMPDGAPPKSIAEALTILDAENLLLRGRIRSDAVAINACADSVVRELGGQ
jgi:hypothetical protein